MRNRLFSLILCALFCTTLFATVPDGEVKNSFVCDGATTTFNYTFNGANGSDLEVWVITDATGAADLLTPSSEYTVSATNNLYSNGGTVTVTTAPASGNTLWVVRKTPKTQTAVLTQSRTIESALDRLARMVQELADDFSRALRVPLGDTVTDPNVAYSAAAGYLYRDGVGGLSWSNAISASLLTLAGGWLEVLAGDANGTERLSAKAYLGVDHAIDVRDYGAAGDGTTDDTTAIQAAVDAAEAAGGGIVFFPQGTYKTTASLSLPTAVTARGSGYEATTIYVAADVKGLLTDVNAHGWSIRDLRFIVAEALGANTTNAAIYVESGNYDFVIDSVLVTTEAPSNYRFQDGLVLEQVWTGSVRKVRVTGSARYSLDYQSGQAMEFLECDFAGGDLTACARVAANYSHWSACKFQGEPTMLELSGSGHVFSDPYFENSSYPLELGVWCVNISGSYNTLLGGIYSNSAYATAGSGLVKVSGGTGNRIINPLLGVTDANMVSLEGTSIGTILSGGNVPWSQVITQADAAVNTYQLDSYTTVAGVGVNEQLVRLFYGALNPTWQMGNYGAGIQIEAGAGSVSTDDPAGVYATGDTGTAPFDVSGNLVLKPRNVANRSVEIWTGATPTQRLKVDESGIVTTVPLRIGGNSASHSYGNAHAAWSMTATEAAATLFTVTLADQAADAVFPAAVAGKMYVVYNNSGQTITFKVSGQAGVASTNGKYSIWTMSASDCVKIYEQP